MYKPELFWIVEPEYQTAYDTAVSLGRGIAKVSKVAIVAIARDSLPFMANTLELVDELSKEFKSCVFYAYENDSTDGTDSYLDSWAKDRPWATIEHATLHRPDYRGFEPERTVALAEYRNRCRLWVEHTHPDADYVIVLDMDPHGGFSIDGVMNSIGWLGKLQPHAGCMASQSLLIEVVNGELQFAHYDAFAARLNWWEDRREKMTYIWFHAMLLPVGSPPIRFNSAFGGLAVYEGKAFLAPGVHYSGGDCEHVGLHKTMKDAGYDLYLNPGARYAAILPPNAFQAQA